MKNIAFIVNPISGTRNKRTIIRQIERILDPTKWAWDIVQTEYRGHGKELARQYANLGFDAVAAVGGDGTVNEIASGLIGTQTALAIVPIGSGNGFARHLDIPLRVNGAIELINNSETVNVDYGMVNDIPFFCTCGSGFDAYIADKFAKSGKRGFTTYLEHILHDFFQYQAQTYHLEGDGIDFTTDAFLITFANANQWGNAAYIAPKASLQDGLLDISIMSKFPLHAVPNLAIKLFEKHIDDTTYITTLRANEITLTRPAAGPFHYDGEAIELGEKVHIKLIHDGLKVLVARRF